MSEKSVDVSGGLIAKQGARGRRTYNVAVKRALAQQCSHSGVSVAGLALQHGVNANLLRRWMVQYCEPKGSDTAEAVPARSAAKLLAVTTPMPSSARVSHSSDSYIEITFAAATLRVRGAVDARVLNVVLDCLAQRT
jgi:transposase